MTTPASPAACVIDTHILIWTLTQSRRLSKAALAALQAAEASGSPVYVSAITVVELRYLVEKGTITEANYREALKRINNPATALTPVALDLTIADVLAQIPRATVPDMPDRIIAATALALGLPLISADTEIRKLTNITIIR